jgi:hypothetical protein
LPWADPHLEVLREKSLDMLDVVLEAHGSTHNAQRISSPGFNVYKAAERAYCTLRLEFSTSKMHLRENWKSFLSRTNYLVVRNIPKNVY